MDPRRQSQVESSAVREVNGAGHGHDHGMLQRVLVILLIVLSFAGILYFGAKALSAATADSSVKSKQFQAVFLTNGQVYFGKLADINSSWVKLTDIYYLQVQQQVQPTDSKAAANQQPQVSLAKLGNELHGPEDVMYVDRSQVLFWENLKNDGKVVTAIKDYKANGSK